MNIKRAKQEIKDTIAAYLQKDSHGEYEILPMRQRPVLLMGPPGIGKTQIMEQAARECGVALVAYTITHHTRQSAIGLPFIAERTYGGQLRHVTEYTMSEIVASVYEKMEETGLSEGILFLDEINCVSETLTPAMLQFLQYKTFGNHKLPEGWLIAAAGNPPEYNKSVRDFDIATLDRVKKISVEADFEVWKEYAKQAGIHPAILSYLTAKPTGFYQVETTVDGKIFATPRGWEDLSGFLKVYEKLGKTIDREVVSQYLQHPKLAKDFANYLELYYKYQDKYQIDQALSGVRDERLMEQAKRASFDEKLSIISLILAKLHVEFDGLRRTEDYLELVFTELKDGKEALESQGIHAMEMRIQAFTEAMEQRKRAGLFTRREQYLYEDAAKTLNRYLQAGKGEGWADGAQIFSEFRSLFLEERDAFEEKSRQAGQMLEYAFDFMEGAFGDSQEMVSFITELNSDGDAVKFIGENGCERYYQYNKRLLFENRETEIKRRLERLGIL